MRVAKLVRPCDNAGHADHATATGRSACCDERTDLVVTPDIGPGVAYGKAFVATLTRKA